MGRSTRITLLMAGIIALTGCSDNPQSEPSSVGATAAKHPNQSRDQGTQFHDGSPTHRNGALPGTAP